MSKYRNFKGSLKPFGLGAINSSSSFTSLHKTWMAKLAKSGFNDIELSSYQDPGQVLPIFRYGGSSYDLGQAYSPETAEYYNQARAFLHAISWRKHFGNDAKLLKYIWRLYSEGISIRNTAKALEGLPLAYPYNSLNTKPHPSFKQRRGIWWIHKQIHRVMPAFKAWQATLNSEELSD